MEEVNNVPAEHSLTVQLFDAKTMASTIRTSFQGCRATLPQQSAVELDLQQLKEEMELPQLQQPHLATSPQCC